MSDELDAFFGPRRSAEAPEPAARLGIVVGGSLSKGLDVKLDRTTVIEGVMVGRYAVVEGSKYRFFGMITDVALDNTNPALAKSPPDVSDSFLAEIYAGTSVFGRLSFAPMLVLERGAQEPKPVKSLPGHYAAVYNATEEDVNRIFGSAGEEGKKYFHIGEPLDMEGIKIHVDLERFVERSSGVFGKSGTGKTFLCRELLAGVIQQDAAVNLVFDMHNEYGWQGTVEGGHGAGVKGLKQLFPSKVAIFTLDDASSRRRGVRPDFVVDISYDQIEPEDIIMLGGLLNLSEAQVGAIYALDKRWGREWFARTVSMTAEDMEELSKQYGQHEGTLAALRRNLSRLQRFSFLKPHVESPSVQRILEYLNKGMSVVLEFGRYGSSLEAYVLVANYLTRRLHEIYVRRKEEALGERGAEPRPLVIVIEEAHKFLDPQVARETIFGTIARELRKYNVTLLIVDQRPSGIDEEVMSQIGTRVTCLLDNERDIQAVLMGVSGAGELRQVLARLDTKQQALILGHAVRMPVVVKTRPYDAEFYRSMGYVDGEELQAKLDRNRELLRGKDDDGF